MLRCTIVIIDNEDRRQIMAFSSTLIHSAGGFASALPLAQAGRLLFTVSVLVAFVMFFRPLLVGIVRALMLTVRPRVRKQGFSRQREGATVLSSVAAEPVVADREAVQLGAAAARP